jgi:hypothetical protein
VLFRRQILAGIHDGSITLAFRRWRRPSVRAGGTLLTSVGQIAIGAVDVVDAAAISPDDARRAGHASVQALRDELNRGGDGDVYRIELKALRPDPRIGLRESVPDAAAADTIVQKLRRLDAHASRAWTATVLDVIAERPGVRAADLCRLVGMEKDAFKVNVRKLKTLGLTESLEIGYRLSPRGRTVREALRREPRAPDS